MSDQALPLDATPAPSRSIRLKLWERATSWLVLVAALLNACGVAYTVAANWAIAVDGLLHGTIPRSLFAMPFVFIAAAVLLVRLSKWCLPLFVLHVVGSIGLIGYYYGLAAMPWYYPLGYLAEVLTISLALRLLGRGLLH